MIRAVVFDLGGVLIRHDPAPILRALGPEATMERWYHWMLTEPVARRYECGACGFTEFAERALEAFGSPTTGQEAFQEAFVDWVSGPAAEAPQLVSSVRTGLGRYCLSNCNALHWDRLATMGVGEWFDRSFLSHELGLAKPDEALFAHVAHAIGLEPERLLFLDDNASNVETALGLGWGAEQVRGIGETRRALERRGLLGP